MTEDELDRLLDKLTLRAKVRLLTGATTWRTPAEPDVGLRELVMSDGPAGVRGESWDERRTALLLPSASALAATWDVDLVERLGALLAAEARRKGVHVVLAPNLNLHRSPLGGRHFECFSEDPVLTSRVGAALIRGIQSRGVAATAKHFVANDSETDRLTVDVRAGERALREVYLAPFEAAVAAGVQVVMAGYNSVNGTTMTASPLLSDPLRSEWGFDGVVVSDWGAARTTHDTARSGLDLAMPGPESVWGEALAQAVEDGRVPESAVDGKVRRLLALADRAGVLGEPGEARPPARGGVRPRDARAQLRRAASAGTVLLANRGVLPLGPEVRTVAVVGAHAARTRTQGGGSAGVFPQHEVSVLEGLRALLRGRAGVVHAPGPCPDEPAPALDMDLCSDPRSGLPGVLLRMLDASGSELYAEHRNSGRQLEPRLVPGAHTVEISARLRPRVAGRWTLGIAGFGRMRLSLDERTLVEGEFARETDDPALVHVNPPVRSAEAWLAVGQDALLVARRELAPDTGRATVVSAAPPRPDASRAIAGAVRAAAEADAVVVVVGTTEHSESEGYDRSDLTLGATQNALVRAVAAANPRTVAVVNSGGPVELPWRDEVGALLLAWFPGQEGGGGLADVILGRAEPGGRLPTTWPVALADAPVTGTRPVAGRLEYTEGLHIGYRGWLRGRHAPAYWFGHGLGYTDWSYEELTGPREVAAGEPFTVRVGVRNTGPRAGREVVQVYLARPGSALEYPRRWLAGFAAVHAGPGATATASVTVPAAALRHWSVGDGGWRTEPGPCRVLAGRSASDLPLDLGVEVRVRG
ncbi:glycoside hydrolase family 3 C-terminal domain-containing protein [Streptomyces fructofermentans]|uniref:Glycosyl hydrolase n=1 Tax=Streptomyces fructofermentans TaxID=152141 RepID=A0A918KDJ0_9ACTN|nr:glycoside hydrolase family 3 C-terminal domain-containing protein [Streptomyces fructofermentans]GGX58022.1 glycosyl hydrolase [Streptomyces fructofermentans]